MRTDDIRRNDAGFAMQSQCRAFDQSPRQQLARAAGASFERILDFTGRQFADIAGDEARAEIAVRLQVVRRSADDAGMSGQIDRVGDDGCRGVGLRGSVDVKGRCADRRGRTSSVQPTFSASHILISD